MESYLVLLPTWSHTWCYFLHGVIPGVTSYMESYLVLLPTWSHTWCYFLHGVIPGVTSYMESYLVLLPTWSHTGCYFLHGVIPGVTSYMESYLVFTGITRDGSCRRSPDFRLHMRTPSHSLPLRSCKLIASDMSSATCHHIEGLDNVLLLSVKKWKTHMNDDLPNDHHLRLTSCFLYGVGRWST